MTDTIWSSNEFDGILQETQQISLQKEKSLNVKTATFSQSQSHFHQIIIYGNGTYSNFSEKKDCQRVFDGISSSSHKFSPTVRLGQPDPQSILSPPSQPASLR